jgi:hypothetical protein
VVVAGLLAYGGLVAWYAAEPHFFDNAEPTIVSTAWLLHLGKPAYPAVDAAPRYAHIYGPLTFALQAFALSVIGPSLVGAKVFAASAALLALGLFAWIASRICGWSRALGLAGGLAWCLLNYQQRSFWTRPEPFELLAVVIAIGIAVSTRGIAGAIALGLCLGCLANLKFTGPLYALAPAFVLLARQGTKGVAPMMVAALVALLAPFMFIPGIDWRNYIEWIQLSAHTGLLFGLLHQNLDAAIILLLIPFLSYHATARRRMSRSQHGLVVGLIVGMAAVCLAAAKPGAGPYHLIPFVPVVFWLAAECLGRAPIRFTGAFVPSLAGGVLVALVTIAMLQTNALVSQMAPRRARHEAADMLGFLTTHPGTAAMGYGSDESLSLERPVLVFRTGINLIDQPAIREYHLQGLEMPGATLQAMRDCGIRYWFVPAGEEPFSGRSSYGAVLGQMLYPRTFRETFLDSHRKVAATDYYDVWECSMGIQR